MDPNWDQYDKQVPANRSIDGDEGLDFNSRCLKYETYQYNQEGIDSLFYWQITILDLKCLVKTCSL